MTDWRTELDEALRDFVTAAGLSHTPLRFEDLQIEYFEAPHNPPSHLPAGKMAIYGFWYAGEWLKIGMAGPKSSARFISQHYNANSAPSTLAASLLKDQQILGSLSIDINSIGFWIKSNCNRVNILLDNDYGILLLRFLEAFLHIRMRPRYEK